MWMGAGCLLPWAPLSTTQSSRICPRELPGLFTPTCGRGDAGKDGEDSGDAVRALAHPSLLPRVQVASLPGIPGEGFSPFSEHWLWGTPCRAWRGTGEVVLSFGSEAQQPNPALL